MYLGLLWVTLINANVTCTSDSLRPYWSCLAAPPPKAVCWAGVEIIRALVKREIPKVGNSGNTQGKMLFSLPLWKVNLNWIRIANLWFFFFLNFLNDKSFLSTKCMLFNFLYKIFLSQNFLGRKISCRLQERSSEVIIHSLFYS